MKDICEIISDSLIIFNYFIIITNLTKKLGKHFLNL
jgi:hypothetical protein